MNENPDSKVHGANMEPTWVLSAPDGPHVGPMNLAIRETTVGLCNKRYPSETDLKLNFHESFFAHNIPLNHPIDSKFCKVHDSDCAVLYANFETIVWLINQTWGNEFLSDLDLRCVSDGYPIFHSPKAACHACNRKMVDN